MSNFFQKFLPYIAGAGASGLASQFSALSPFSAAIGAGAGALTGKNPLSGAAAGFAGGGVGSTLAGGLKGAFSGGAGSNPLDNFGSGAVSGLQSYGSSIPGFGGVGTSNPTGAFAKFFSGGGGTPPPNNGGGTGGFKLSNGSSGFSNTAPFSLPSLGGSSALGSTTGAVGTPAGSAAGSPLSMFKSLIPGAAVAGLGNLLAPTPAAPDYSSIEDDLRNRIQTGGDPVARQAAETQYLSTINAPTGASAESGVANAKLISDRQRAQAVKDLQDQFTANNGSLTGNSAYNDALAKTNAQYDQNYSAQAAQTQFDYDNQQQQNKLAAANALAGMDNTQLQYYAGLANLSAQQIQDQFQLDAGRAQGLKDIATQAGTLLMEKSLGLNGGGK